MSQILIHFMPVDECHTHALPSALENSWPGLHCDAVKPQGCISWPVWPLRGINKTAWGAKLILTAGPVHHSSCASLGHLLMAQHCHFCLGVCFSPPTAPHPPPPPTPPRPPPIDSIRVITDIKNQKKFSCIKICKRSRYFNRTVSFANNEHKFLNITIKQIMVTCI